MSIPKRIVQTGKDRELSPRAKAAVTSLKLLHPDWEYVYYTDNDVQRFVASEFPQYSNVFDGFQFPIQRIDFFRYLFVYRYGGFYFDLDVFLSEDLSPLLENLGVFPFEELSPNEFLRNTYNFEWAIGNYAFGAVPEHPYLAAVIANCVRAQKDPAWVSVMMKGIPSIFRAEYTVLNTTGPGILSRTMAENPKTSENVTILLPEDILNPDTWHQFGRFGVHIMNGSWRTRGNYLRRRLMSLWERSVQRRRILQGRRQSVNRTQHQDTVENSVVGADPRLDK